MQASLNNKLGAGIIFVFNLIAQGPHYDEIDQRVTPDVKLDLSCTNQSKNVFRRKLDLCSYIKLSFYIEKI